MMLSSASSPLPRPGPAPLPGTMISLHPALALTTKLTQRQWQVGLLLTEGMSNLEIAQRLAMSARTVKAHAARLFLILRCGNGCKRVQCAVKLYRFLLDRRLT